MPVPKQPRQKHHFTTQPNKIFTVAKQ
ncbi:hypothetical protein E2C01_101097 [Portunus trituberculatus]|uniref:Uncharacterized protein n=1 Tax=Portunus trituberculatus TaxID=210409 RepID=A0A5B7KJ71_PORTR|nr:hypothetical protein [Portunus trituberculatus]